MNKEINKRLTALRNKMKEEGMTAYYITTSDYHSSEYVSDYFKVREFFSGFTGSNGDLLVFENRAILWTDGRYFVQAERELEGTGIELFKMGEEGVPKVTDFIRSSLKRKDTLGFDGRTVSTSFGLGLEKAAKEKHFSLRYDTDLSKGIFIRPAFPVSPAEVLPDELTGESVSSKLQRVRAEIKKMGAKALILTKLDDIMYLFNIRGNDVEYNPVLMSYAYISGDMSRLFLGHDAVNSTLIRHLAATDTRVLGYDDFGAFLTLLQENGKVLIDPGKVNYFLYKTAKENLKIMTGTNPTEIMKAVKNDTELMNIKETCLKDSAAVAKFILRLLSDMEVREHTEESAADLLLSFRKEIKEYRDLSFSTISAYGENAAMMHYEPGITEVKLEKKEMLLVDSGAQYNGGTTDITRTIVLGEISEEEKTDYTLTACSMLNLMHVKWLKGCTGRNLDIIARQRMWERGMDYKCGTGHGIGYILNVHEGPQTIRWMKYDNEAELECGMIVSDEPGVYKKGKYGIRIENLLSVKDWKKTDDGQFMEFENLTFVPIDDRGIDRSFMTEKELEYYLAYQRECLEKLEPYLSGSERDRLREYAGIVD